METEKFVLLLPSDVRGRGTEDNKAGDYTMPFDTPLNLDPNQRWQVSLDEITLPTAVMGQGVDVHMTLC